MTKSASLILVATVCLSLACTTAYHARQPQATSADRAPTDEDVAHCLQSIGLLDDSTEEWNARFISEDPELVAIWTTPRRSFWSTTPGCTAAVRSESGAWHVVFVPFSGSTSGAAQALSEAFEHCVELHAPDAEIEVNSEKFLDLR